MSDELFHLIDDVVVQAQEMALPWVLPDLLYYQGAFLIAGEPKVGKTTMLADVIRARTAGGQFAGLDIKSGPTLLLTEEGPIPTAFHWHRATGLAVMFRYEALAAWAEGRKLAEEAGAIGHDKFSTSAQKARAEDQWTFASWTDRRIREWCEGQRHALVIVDTLSVWSQMEDENDASEAMRAISRWTKLAQDTGACIVLVHHMRKSGGANGSGIRGSSAFLGTADGSWQVERLSEDPTDTRRRVTTTNRMGFSVNLTMDYNPDTGSYLMAGDEVTDINVLLADIPSTGGGYTIKELADTWELGRSAAQKRATRLLDIGRLRREQVKRDRGMPWLYWSIPPAAVTPLQPFFRDDFDEAN